MTFSHCNQCGSLLPAPPPTRCGTCGAAHYRNAKPCACACVSDGDRLLLLRRGIEPWRYRWDTPGGFCEVNEHPVVTAEREAFEESGLKVRATGFIGAWLDEYPDPRQERGAATTLNLYYLAVPSDGPGDFVPSVEATEAGWFSPNELPLKEIAFPEHQIDALRAWQRIVTEGIEPAPLLDVPRR